MMLLQLVTTVVLNVVSAAVSVARTRIVRRRCREVHIRILLIEENGLLWSDGLPIQRDVKVLVQSRKIYLTAKAKTLQD